MACKGVAVAVLERTSAADEGPDSAGGSSQAARRRAKRELAAAVASAAAAAEPLGGWTPQAAGTVADVYATIGAKDRAKYEAHFSRADKTSEGLVAREEAGLLFSRAKVPAAAIDSIYDHCVPEGSDGLDSVAFAAAMHLVYAALRAKLAHLLDSKPPIRTGTDDDTNIDEEEEDKDDDGEEVAQQAVFPAKNADAPTAERDAPTRFAASDSAVSEGTESYASSGSNGEIVPASAVGAAGDAAESAGFSTLESAAFEQARVAEAEAEASAGPESSFANAPAEGFAAFDSAVFEPAAAGHSPLSKGFATFGSNALDPTPSASDGAPEAAHAQGPAESQQQEQEPQPQQQAPTSAADIGAPPAFEADFSDSAAFSASGASGEPSIVSSSSSEGSAVAAKQPPRKRQLFSNAAFEADISSPQGDDEEGGGDLDESFGESPEFHTPSTEEPAEDAGEFGGAQSDSSDGMEAHDALAADGIGAGAACASEDTADLQEELVFLDAELDAMEKQKSAIKVATHATKRQHEDLKQMVISKSAALFESKKVLGELEQQLAKVQGDARNTRSESDAMQAELNELKQRKLELVRARDTGARATTTPPSKRGTNSALAAEIAAERAEIALLESQLADANGASLGDEAMAVEELTAELASLRVSKSRITQELEAAIDAQESRRQALEERGALKREALAAAQGLLDSKRAELARARAENDALEQELNASGMSAAEVQDLARTEAAAIDSEIAAERDRSVDLVAVLGESASLGYESADVSSSQARPHNRKPSEDFIEFGRHNRSGSTTRWAFDPNRSDDGGDMVFIAPASTAVASTNEGDEHSDASMAILASPGTVIKTGAHDGGSGFSSFLYGGDAPAARRGIGANGGVDADTDCADTVVVSRGPSFGEADFGDAAFSSLAKPKAASADARAPESSADVGDTFETAFDDAFGPPTAKATSSMAEPAPDAAGGMKLFNNDAFDGVLGDAEPKPDNTAPAAVTTAAVGVFDNAAFDDDAFGPASAGGDDSSAAAGAPLDSASVQKTANAPADGIDDVYQLGSGAGETGVSAAPAAPGAPATFDPKAPTINLAELMPKPAVEDKAAADDLGAGAGPSSDMDDLFGSAPADGSAPPSGMEFFGLSPPKKQRGSSGGGEGVDDIFASLGGTSVAAPPSPVAAAPGPALSSDTANTPASSMGSVAPLSAATGMAVARVGKWRTLSNTERTKCEKAFTALAGTKTGATVSAAGAKSIFARICKHVSMFFAVWELAAKDGANQAALSLSEFCLFMHMAKQLARRGATLPAPPLSAAERAHLLGSNRRRSAATTPSTSNASTPQLSPRNSPQKHGSATATASAADRGKEVDAAVSAGASTSVGAGDVAAGAATASVTARSGRQKKRVPRLKPVAVPPPATASVEPDSEPEQDAAPEPAPAPAPQSAAAAGGGSSGSEKASDPRAAMLASMGFSTAAAMIALEMFGDDTDAAVEFLIEHPEAGQRDTPKQGKRDVNDASRVRPPNAAVTPSPATPTRPSAGGSQAADFKRTNSQAPLSPSPASPATASSAAAAAPTLAFRFCVDEVTLKKKDVQRMNLPFFQMSLATAEGRLLERQSKTAPNTGRRGEGTLLYGPSTVLGFKTPLSRLPSDAAVYFELMHYKPDKKKNSCMAWSYAPLEMIKTGKFSLPLFEKPIDVSRRRCKRLNKKGLDLTVSFSVPR